MYGKKIFEKIQEAMKPVFEGDTAIDPFDFWQGANFRLKIKRVEGYPNYDNSSFENQCPLLDGDDKKLEEVWNSLYNLSEFHDPKNFKTYEELAARLDRVLGIKSGSTPPVSAGPAKEAKPAPKVETKTTEVPWNSSEDTEEEDESLEYFRKLAED
jgi:hypothetical protein